MKRLGLTIVSVAAFFVSACATPSAQAPPVQGHKFGSVGTSRGCLAPLNTVTGNSATVIVFDTSTDTGARLLLNSGAERLVMGMYFDQAVTVNYQVKHRGSSTWRTINGNGSGDTVAASTDTTIDFRIIGQDNRITVVTGGTGPTTAEVDICPTYETPASM